MNLLPFIENKIVLLSIAVLRLIEDIETQSTGVRSRSFADFSFSAAGARVPDTLASNAALHASHNKRLVRPMVPSPRRLTSLYALLIAWSRHEEKAGIDSAHIG
jgi:hypothetical protein